MKKNVIIAEIVESNGSCEGCFVLNMLKGVDKENYPFYGNTCPLYDCMCNKAHVKFVSINKDEYNNEIIADSIKNIQPLTPITSSDSVINFDKEKINVAKDIFFKQLTNEYVFDDIVRGIADENEIHRLAKSSALTASIFIDDIADKLILKKDNK